MVRLIHGEAIEEMRKLPPDSVDLVLCDPPFGTTHNEWDRPIPTEEMFCELKRICKGAICLFADGMYVAELMVGGKDIWRYNLIWDKQIPTGFLNANRMPLRVHEEICVFYDSPPQYHPLMVKGGKPIHSRGSLRNAHNSTNYGKHVEIDRRGGETDRFPQSIISIPKVHPSKCVHPTQKPVELMEWLIRTFTFPGDTVLDFAMGSGTTMIAARNLDRKGIGIELNKEIYKIAEKRVKEPYQLRLENLFQNEG